MGLQNTAGTDNKTPVWDYKIQLYSVVMCYALRPLPDFSRVEFCADSAKIRMRL